MGDPTEKSTDPASEAAPGSMPTAADLERIRSLQSRLLHLESVLERRTEQVAIWRQRAEERKAKLDELRARQPVERRRGFGRRTGAAPQPPPPAPLRVVEASATTADHSTGATVHPSIHVGVVHDPASPLPELVARTAHTLIAPDGDARALGKADVLLLVGSAAAEAVDRAEFLADWVVSGQPTAAIDTHLRGVPTVPTDSLAFFDPADDLFGKSSVRFDRDNDLLATLGRLQLHDPIGFLANADPSPMLDRAAADALRRARSERSPQVVGERLLATAGTAVPTWRPEALAVLMSRRPDRAVTAAHQLAAQTYRPLRVVVGLHGDAATGATAVRDVLEPSGLPHTVIPVPADVTLGDALNHLIAESPGDVVFKIDDDDHYAPGYVEDMMGALAYSGADVTGKAAFFTRLDDDSIWILPGSPYEATEHVHGPTLTISRHVWDAVRFPPRRVGVDSAFSRGVRAAGFSIISHHPWGFAFDRHGVDHTWDSSASYFRGLGTATDLSLDAVLGYE